MEPNLHVAITTDEKYIQHAGAMLASLFAHAAGAPLVIHCITHAAGTPDFKKLAGQVARAGHQLRVLVPDDAPLRGLKLSDHATTAVYYRLLLPELIDPAVPRVLYLDSDLIVKEDVRQLWNTEVGGYALAAVRDPLFSDYEKLGIPAGRPYFNSGVMLLNLDHWRQHGHARQVLAYIRSNPDKITAWDQDGLNAVLHSQWLELHPRWNVQTILFEHAGRDLPVPADVIAECLANPAVIHYTAKFKPWHRWCEHPRKGEYYRYLAATPWRDFRPGESAASPLQTIWKRLLRSV